MYAFSFKNWPFINLIYSHVLLIDIIPQMPKKKNTLYFVMIRKTFDIKGISVVKLMCAYENFI